MKHVLLLFVIFLGGCAATMATIPADPDYGEFPANYQDTIKAWIGERLKDPYSAKWTFGPPEKAYLRDAPIAGGKPAVYGYVVRFTVNAKNSYGAYIGDQQYRVFLRDGKPVTTFASNPYFAESWYRE